MLNRCIGPATLVITESEKLKTMISQQFSKDKNRIISIPNGPSPLLLNYSKVEHNKKKLNLPNEYFFLSSSVLGTQNHIRILEAIKILNDRGSFINFVFCGKDKGNLENIKKKLLK